MLGRTTVSPDECPRQQLATTESVEAACLHPALPPSPHPMPEGLPPSRLFRRRAAAATPAPPQTEAAAAGGVLRALPGALTVMVRKALLNGGAGTYSIILHPCQRGLQVELCHELLNCRIETQHRTMLISWRTSPALIAFVPAQRTTQVAPFLQILL